MNRKDLVDRVGTTTGLSAAQVEATLDAIVATVVDTVAAKERVTLPGFGTFEARHRAARSGRNPQTGEAIDIAASDAPAFKPATAFKQAVSGR